MSRNERRVIDSFDRCLDALVSGTDATADGLFDPSLIAATRDLNARAAADRDAAPRPAFAVALESSLIAQARPSHPALSIAESPSNGLTPFVPNRPAAAGGRRWSLGGSVAAACLLLLLGLVASDLLSTSKRPPFLPAVSVASATPLAGSAPARLLIPRVGVDASVVAVTSTPGPGVLASVQPWLVSWYAGTGRLGAGSNVVLAGRLDEWSYGPAVFARVPELRPGDLVEVDGEDGATYRYRVESNRSYPISGLATASATEILGATSAETLTLMTDGGRFDGQQYVDRVVIRAGRVADATPPAPAASPSTRTTAG